MNHQLHFALVRKEGQTMLELACADGAVINPEKSAVWWENC